MLRCADCGRTDDHRWRCHCGGPLDFADSAVPEGQAPDPASFDTRDGLWSFADFLPVAREVSLGEGLTPLVSASDWDAQFKLEYVFPTGSFKDRGATTTLSRAVAVGADRVVEDSSGNAGAAIATYAARAGLPADIYVPADAKASKLRAIERAGATAIRVEGDRQAVTDACIAAVEGESRAAGDERVYYASHAWDPAFYAGTATMAYEIALQRDWSVPDAVVCPLGHGTLFLGAYRGFRALREAGWIDRVPRLLGVQAEGYAPIAETLHPVESAAGDSNDRADGIQIRQPARREQLLDAVDATDGDVVALGSEAVETELDRLHRAGFYTEPTCAVAPAGLREYRERGVLSAEDDVVVPLTGSGLKN
ncbi:pyridoxal-phosphate dependent enzyme [Salinirubrum litoreum]|uniref:Pyridoxal-phosphate dependent enzyme n=1 Tax=Salinirubrum litoreum TaxID=1126234 RepID=A0ABD5R6Z5_9EURY|nr:pyridoxal-phosphate dependent enzyme [Salinirubrum litoreum]